MEKRRGHVKTEEETGAMQPHTKEGPQASGAIRSHKSQGKILPSHFWRDCSPNDTLISDI